MKFFSFLLLSLSFFFSYSEASQDDPIDPYGDIRGVTGKAHCLGAQCKERELIKRQEIPIPDDSRQDSSREEGRQ